MVQHDKHSNCNQHNTLQARCRLTLIRLIISDNFNLRLVSLSLSILHPYVSLSLSYVWQHAHVLECLCSCDSELFPRPPFKGLFLICVTCVFMSLCSSFDVYICVYMFMWCVCACACVSMDSKTWLCSLTSFTKAAAEPLPWEQNIQTCTCTHNDRYHRDLNRLSSTIVFLFVCVCVYTKQVQTRKSITINQREIMTGFRKEGKKEGFIVILEEGQLWQCGCSLADITQEGWISSQCNKGHQVWGRGDGRTRRPHRWWWYSVRGS